MEFSNSNFLQPATTTAPAKEKEMNDRSPLFEPAHALLSADLSVLPANRADKRPSIGKWKQYQHRRPSASELSEWFSEPQDGVCIVCGRVSGNLECLDFDSHGEAFPNFQSLVQPELGMRLVCENSPSGGVHVFYRCSSPVDGNQKLALAENGGVLIETRGEGGIVLCAPTEGYELFQGEFATLPLLSPEERTFLLDAARSLNRKTTLPSPPPVAKHPEAVAKVARFSDDSGFDILPGEDFDARGDIRPLLEAHGWTMVHGGENEGWKRPGKEGDGQSATFNGTVFYVFSSNAQPFEPNKGYGKFGVYAALEHDGDLRAATAALAEKGFGRRSDPTAGVDITDVVSEAERTASPEQSNGETEGLESRAASLPPPDPTIDPVLFTPPGFLGEFVRCGMDNAICANRPLLFVSAITALSTLMGQRFRTERNTWPNFYAIGVARTSTGKGVGQTITHNLFAKLDVQDRLCGKPASGPAVQDCLLQNGVSLFECDEAGDLFRAINAKGEAAAAASSMRSALLNCWSASSSLLTRRALAYAKGPDNFVPKTRRNPQSNLVAFVQPSEFWDHLTPNDLSSGLIPRCLVLEGDSAIHDPDATNELAPSEKLLELGKLVRGPGLEDGCISQPDADPDPTIVEISEEVQDCRRTLYRMQDQAIASFNRNGEEVAADLYGKAMENVEKMSLIYAVSEDPESPRLTTEGYNWAWQLWSQSVTILLNRIKGHVASSDHQRLVQRIVDCVKKQDRGNGVTQSELTRRFQLPRRVLEEALDTATTGGNIRKSTEKAPGKPGPATTRYHWVG